MNFYQDLGKLKLAIDKELEFQLSLVINEAENKDLLIAKALEQIKKIALSGGKRIRGALLCQAYFGVGGSEKKKILKAAVAIELVHLFLLVHDDIIDRGDQRHGKETINAFFKREYVKKKIKSEQAEHLGNSMAIIVGDMLYAQALKIILEAGFETENVVKMLSTMQSVISTTIIGQSQDLSIAQAKNLKDTNILAMYENKTARYTFEGPLQMGAMLGGCFNAKTLRAFSSYALPLGIAFQIQDDVLSMFGSQKKVGKSAASDIEEGKRTLMVWKALDNASASQKQKLETLLGKKNISAQEVEDFRNIIKQTGALQWCQNQVSENLQKGKKEVTKMILLPEAKAFLSGLVEYLQSREK